jgi:hypothetical protein
MAGHRPGPDPKGDRCQVTVRLPRTNRALYERAAAAVGLPLSDYIALALARAHQLEDPDYLRVPGKEALPLGA